MINGDVNMFVEDLHYGLCMEFVYNKREGKTDFNEEYEKRATDGAKKYAECVRAQDDLKD